MAAALTNVDLARLLSDRNTQDKDGHLERMRCGEASRYLTSKGQCAAAPTDDSTDLFGHTRKIKRGNNAIVRAFQKRLKKIAGFPYVSEPLPMRNKVNAVVYDQFFASARPVAENIVTDIFSNYQASKTT